LRACIHRGSHQIGGSCVEVESGGERLLIDLGLPLDVDDNTIAYLPPIAGLDGNDPGLKGILISHPHIDHYGLLAHISPELPVGMGAAARHILAAAAPWMPSGFNLTNSGWDFRSGEMLEIGSFRVTPYLMDHSAYDAYALLIEADEKRLFYSGDFRGHGRKATLYNDIISNPPADVDALLLEGTTLGRSDNSSPALTEKEIETRLVEVFKATPGLAMVHTSAQNIDRIVSIFRASKRSGRRLLIDLYTAAVLEATRNPNVPQSHWPEVALFVPHKQRIKIKENGWFELLKRHSINRIFIEQLRDNLNKFTLLFRPVYRDDLEKGGCLEGACYIYSLWEGYWNRGSFDRVADWLSRNSIHKQSLHTSGHADPEDLHRLVEAIKPEKVTPIHTFRPDLYPGLFPNVEFHEDGEWWEI